MEIKKSLTFFFLKLGNQYINASDLPKSTVGELGTNSLNLKNLNHMPVDSVIVKTDIACLLHGLAKVKEQCHK